jgi:uncharacterized protein YecT (DUF1311 family)
MKGILLSLVTTLSAVGAAAQDAAPYAVKDCGQFTAQPDLNACAGANLKAADAALNDAYQALMTQQNDGASRRQLKDVESAWISYRDKECAYEVGPQQSGGSIWPMEMSNCLETMTAARLRELMRLRGCVAGASGCAAR